MNFETCLNDDCKPKFDNVVSLTQTLNETIFSMAALKSRTTYFDFSRQIAGNRLLFNPRFYRGTRVHFLKKITATKVTFQW